MVVTAAAAACRTAPLLWTAISDGPDECDAAAKGAVRAVPVGVAQSTLSAWPRTGAVAGPAAAVTAAREFMDDMPAAVVASRVEKRFATGATMGMFGAAVEASVRMSVMPGKTVLILFVTVEISATAA